MAIKQKTIRERADDAQGAAAEPDRAHSTAPSPESVPDLTPRLVHRNSGDSPDEIDRLVANRAIARSIARMLWEHERQWVASRKAQASRSTAKGATVDER